MNIQRLVEVQERLSEKVVLKDAFNTDNIGGVDIAYKGNNAFCGAVILEYDTLSVIEEIAVKTKVTFPYIPTFLTFRELEPILKALDKIKLSPDILMIDGHGIAHPRRLGIASHLGVLLKTPTIGVAKKLLCGEVKGETCEKKARGIFIDGEKVGYAVKTKKDTKEIYVSPGNMVSLKSSLKILMHCIREHRLPEPTRLAHELATKSRDES